MSATDPIHIFAICEILKISLIDGGDTLAIQLRDTAGDEVAILAAVGIAGALNEAMRTTLAPAQARPPRLSFPARFEESGPAPRSTAGGSPAPCAPLRAAEA